MAGDLVESGRIRLTRGGLQSRVDKAARPVKVGDELIFALAGRLVAIRIEALGVRRGPAREARSLYACLENN